MKKILNEPVTYFLGYVFMIFLTFGHAYNKFPDTYQSSMGNYTMQYGILEKAIGSVFASVGWPLYWSVQGWKK